LKKETIMKNLNKLASVCCSAALGMMMLTGCEGSELYSIGAPDWLSEKADSIANSKTSDEEVLEGMEEDVYTVGATDFSTGWWAQFSKYYQIPDGEKWNAVFNLAINPNASNTYKNFALILTNDVERGGAGYTEYGAIRFDNQPSGNSEWGDVYIGLHRDWVESNLTFGSDTDAGVDKLGGRVVLTIDRSRVDTFLVKITNGTVTKTFLAPEKLPNLNADATNTNIRAFLVPEGSYISFLQSNIEPIGGFTSAEDKNPTSLTISGVPAEVLMGTDLAEAMANVTGTVTFEEGVSKDVTAADLTFQAIPDMATVGTKTLVVMYSKTFKGANCSSPVAAVKAFSVVAELSAYTQTVVVPTPLTLGTEDCTTAWWTAFTDNIKVAPNETKVVNFTNYSSGANNWNNFCIVLNKEDVTQEYAVVRSDNYGWGNGYGACTATMEEGRDWATWLAAMNGAKVTAYITNNGDGKADIRCVMTGNDGNVYTQEYVGINTIDPEDMCFRFVVDGSYIVFDNELGTADCTTAWWTAFSPNVKVRPNQVCTINFTNYSSGANNWNNFCIVLNKEDVTKEYAVVRSDNYGWGNGYGACTATMEDGRDWATWLGAMNGAKVSVQIANKGDGTADIKCVMIGNDGNTYTQDYIGINTIDPDDCYFRFIVDGSYLVFE
jgi:hypothetical protein